MRYAQEIREGGYSIRPLKENVPESDGNNDHLDVFMEKNGG